MMLEEKHSSFLKSPQISLEQWVTFIAVVDEGSYAKAAEVLSKSQSTISYGVSRIEELLNGQLFKQRGRKSELTVFGNTMLRHARKLVDNATSTEKLARCLADGWESEATLVVDAICPTDKILQALQRFDKEGKPTRITLRESTLSGTEEAFFQSKTDIVISARVPPGFMGIPYLKSKFIAVANPKHPLFSLSTPISLTELSKHKQVVVSDSGSKRNQDAGWLGSEERLTVTHFSTSIRVVKRGLAFAWLPEPLIKHELQAGELRPLPLVTGQAREYQLFLVITRGEYAGPAVNLLADILLSD